MLANIKPIIRIAIVSLIFEETNITANNTRKLPKLDAITKLHFDANTKAIEPPKNELPIITNATPKLAPELIPSTKGPANGFRNNVCINSPEMPNPEPTIIAVKAFGSL